MARNRLSRTVRSRKSSEDWYVRLKPRRMRSWGGSSVMSSPKKRTRPAVGGKSPVTALNSVVLPAPLAPRMARRSPAATASETPSIARSAPKVRVTPSRTSASSEASSDCGAIAAIGLRTGGVVARADAHLVELGLRQVESLVDLLDARHHLVVERPVGRPRHLGDEVRTHRLAVVVERDRARRSLQLQLGERFAILRLVAGEVALHRVERVERRLHVDVVVHGEEAGRSVAVGEVLLVRGDEGLPFRRVIGIGVRAGGERAEERLAPLALEVEDV